MTGHNTPIVRTECCVLKSIDFMHCFHKMRKTNTSKEHVLFHVTSEGVQNELPMLT